VLSGSGCYDRVLVPGEETDGRLTVTNDEQALDARVTYTDENVDIESGTQPSLVGAANAPPALAPSSITLTLISEVEPPMVAGSRVQATSVWATRDDRTMVSYGMVGSATLGALDHFKQLTRKVPKLHSSVSFSDSDVIAVMTDGTVAYAAAATSDVAQPAPAVLERINLEGEHFDLGSSQRLPLASFVATSVTSTGSVIYATSGDAGAVFAFDAGDLSLLGQYDLDNARWVAWDEDNDRIVVLQGTPGRLAVFQEGAFPGGSMSLLNTFAFPGADVSESKSAMEIAGGKAFVAAGPEGVQVVCLDDGQIIGSVPRPDPASVGLDPSVVVTNAVTVQDDLMFISNGEAGVYAAAGAASFESQSCGAQQIDVLGRLRFDDLESVNHVAYRGEYLFVAAGLGGLKIVLVEVGG
jgi:hypothetical protein